MSLVGNHVFFCYQSTVEGVLLHQLNWKLTRKDYTSLHIRAQFHKDIQQKILLSNFLCQAKFIGALPLLLLETIRLPCERGSLIVSRSIPLPQQSKPAFLLLLETMSLIVLEVHFCQVTFFCKQYFSVLSKMFCLQAL